jgi:hypothetical protein
MGSADCRSYSRNKRGIAGGLIWINFDRHSLLNLFRKAQGKFVADVDEIRPQYQDSTVGASAVFTSSIVRTIGPSIGSTIDQLDNLSLTEVGGSKELANPWYSDQILPFDITIAGANEYGAMAAAKIFGVEILNEGWGSSIDDAVSEMQATFVARVRWAYAVCGDLVLPSAIPHRLLHPSAPRGKTRLKNATKYQLFKRDTDEAQNIENFSSETLAPISLWETIW